MDLPPLYTVTSIGMFLLSWSFNPLFFCVFGDRLIPGKPLLLGDTVVSDGGAFALGFFSPTNSNTSLYVGIWYNNIAKHTIVWVANRDNPITDPHPALSVTSKPNLIVTDSKGGILWNQNVTSNASSSSTGAAAQLLNSGNLVLLSSNGTQLWQSFDDPTDTMLPNMKMRLNHKECLTCWKSPQDPSPGDFSLCSDPSASLQLIIWEGSSTYWRSKVWSGKSYPVWQQPKASYVVYQSIVVTTGDIYMSFSLSDGSASMRFLMDYTGKLQVLSWNSSLAQWSSLESVPSSKCDLYGSCGPFGYCDDTAVTPTCKCLEGFEPENVTDWMDGNFLRGCRRKEALACGGDDRFSTLPGMKLPDKFLSLWEKSFEDCAAECRANCSCTAYAYANLGITSSRGNTSRCLVWMTELIDTAMVGDGTGENLYLRLAGVGSKRNNVVKIVLSVLGSTLFTACIYFVWNWKFRGRRRNNRNTKMLKDLSGFSELGERIPAHNIEFSFTSFEDIVVATDNFSDSQMLGKGGFGKVYRGMLEGGKEVAVKRLLSGSGQGMEEFRNEVVLIAKLQHKNLVRLLGCCVHRDEKLLIYEYLPNKSLDAFLFDAARKSMLDWPMRFKITQGIARGLLYLHQDSRLTIIHRDLKASNILLDAEMNPKISDFGMARIFGGNQDGANTNSVVGTYGYMSPEYAMEGHFSIKSDVYSFGVLVLEVVSSLRNSSVHRSMDFLNLLAYAWHLWKEGNARDLIDPSLVENCSLDEALRCIHVGLLCVQDNPNARPLMSSVVFMLENETTELPTPKQPAFSFQRNIDGIEQGDNIKNSVNNVTMTIIEGR